jgi:outer membrane protein TolC
MLARTTLWSGGLILAALARSAGAFAQGQPADAAKPEPAGAEAPPAQLPDLVRASASGLTAETVAKRAAATSYTTKAAEAQLRAAAARVDQAWAAFLPRLTVTARYTRLSDFTPPLFGSGGSSVVTTAAPGTLNPSPTIAAPPFSFPLVLDNFLLQAGIVVPITDYFLRINQNHTAATHSVEAARYDAGAARAKSASDGKAAYYTWLRARGASVVAGQALADQKVHLNDAKNQFTAGAASKADVLRAETAVAAAEVQVERAKNLASLAETQVRVAMHAPDDESLTPGETLDGPPPPFDGSLPQLTQEAVANRLEVKGIDANAAAAREQASAVRGGNWPQVAAFADGIVANPNPRRFPQTNDWFPTWQVGAQLTWSPNDTLTSSASGRDIESRASALDAQREVVRDGIRLEVTQAYNSIREADASIEATKRELAAAQEAYRVARELFNAGRGTSTVLTDAETELTRARLDALNAAVESRIARVRLEHALGRDAKMAPAP